MFVTSLCYFILRQCTPKLRFIKYSPFLSSFRILYFMFISFIHLPLVQCLLKWKYSLIFFLHNKIGVEKPSKGTVIAIGESDVGIKIGDLYVPQ